MTPIDFRHVSLLLNHYPQMMSSSLALLRRPLPLTFRLNRSSYHGGSEAAAKLSQALGGG